MIAPSSFTLLWLQAASCGGCANAALDADPPLFLQGERLGVRTLWHPMLSAENGADLHDLLDRIGNGREPLDALVVEGAVLRGPAGSGRFQMAPGLKRPMADLLRDLAGAARHVVAVGSCAAFGGVAATPGNVTEAAGLQFDGGRAGGLLPEDWRGKGGLPVINIAGCAPHPGWIVETLMALAEGTLAPADLDAFNRPRFFADHLAHHGCNRNEYYEFKASAQAPGQQGCLMENLGCKATQAPGDCNRRRWNGVGSCTNAGFACINCTSPGFTESIGPWQETPKVAGIPVGLPVDMPKAWFVALAALSKSATPNRVRKNALADHVVVPPANRPPGGS
ncbi:MAG: HupU protein [Rhodospirillales bacterium]|nr:HupU protein [Rhodospirillales bacterium]